MRKSSELHQSQRTHPFYDEDRGSEDRLPGAISLWRRLKILISGLSKFESHVDNDPNYAYASQLTIEAVGPRFGYASGRGEAKSSIRGLIQANSPR
jgi:hypothetical protein